MNRNDLEGYEDEYDLGAVHSSLEVPLKRVIIHLSVDCFDVQLEMQNSQPGVIPPDAAVVIIGEGEIILAMNYTAKSLSIKLGGKGDGQTLIHAKTVCKQADIPLFICCGGTQRQTPDGNVASFLPETESDSILDALQSCPVFNKWSHSGNGEKFILLERNSLDEFYIDVTQLIEENTKQGMLKYVQYYESKYRLNKSLLRPFPSEKEFLLLGGLKNHPGEKYNGKPATVMEGRTGQIMGEDLVNRVTDVYPNSTEAYHLDGLRLAHGSIIANSIKQHIKTKTGYDVSAGVGHSKLVAKLASGRNKPIGITIMTNVSLPRLSKCIPFQDLPGFEGKTGQRIRDLLLAEQKTDVNSIDDLLRLRSTSSDLDLVAVFKKLGFQDPVTKSMDLQNKCEFKDDSLVIPKVYSDSDAFSTGVSFKGGIRERIWLLPKAIADLASTMAYRINYYKKRGRHAKELCVRAAVIENAKALPGDHSNRIAILGDRFISSDCIDKLIRDYIIQNNLNHCEITKIVLTASRIHGP